mgnify:CR=1 FL=1
MTVRECYEKIGSDFDKVLGRMGSEALQILRESEKDS